MSRLYRTKKSPLDCTQTVHSGQNTFLFNFAAGRDGWVIPSGKMPSGLYIAVRPEDIFLLGISQSPGPPEIIRYAFLFSVINLSQAEIHRFWDKIYAQTGQIYRLVMVSGYNSCSLNLYSANSSHFVLFLPWLQ